MRHFLNKTPILFERTTDKVGLFRLVYLVDIFRKIKWAFHLRKTIDCRPQNKCEVSNEN